MSRPQSAPRKKKLLPGFGRSYQPRSDSGAVPGELHHPLDDEEVIGFSIQVVKSGGPMVMYESVCKFGFGEEVGKKWLLHLAEERRSGGG